MIYLKLFRGFYPKGGGQVNFSVEPVESLRGAFLDKPQKLKRVSGGAFVAGTISLEVIYKAAFKLVFTDVNLVYLGGT